MICCPKCKRDLENIVSLIKMPLRIENKTVWLCEDCWSKFCTIQDLITEEALKKIDDAFSVFIKQI